MVTRLILICHTAVSVVSALASATLEVTSDEGWCDIFIDGAKVGEIPLNAHHTTVGGIAPGEHFLKIADTFGETWYESVVKFEEGDTLRAKAEPAGFTVINKTETPPLTPPEAGKERQTRVRLEYAAYKSLPSLLYVVSAPTNLNVKIDGRDAGATPFVATDLATGKHVVAVGNVEEEVDVKAGAVTKLEITVAP